MQKSESETPVAARTGAELIKATAPYSEESKAKSWFLLLSTIIVLAICWAGTFIYSGELLISIPCAILTALVIVRLFIIYHDQQHGALFRKAPLGHLILNAYGYLVLTPPSVWKSSHDFHHQNNAKLRSAFIGSYPVMTTDHWKRARKRHRILYRFIRHPLTMLCAYPIMFFFGMCVAPAVRDPKRHFDCVIATLLHVALAIYLCYYGGFLLLFTVLLLPFSIAHLLGAYLFYAQHNFPDTNFYQSNEWTYNNAALEASSYMKMGPLMNWFTGNIGYHHIHHLNSRIPFYNLPKAMAAFPELQNPKVTSLNPIDIWRCLRLDLWDSERQKMVRFSEA